MSLVQLWLNSRDQLADKHVQQMIAFAGAGRLQDGSTASKEFREFLANVSSEHIDRYATECLASSFPDGGFALQDVVNEIGTRLGFDVQNGRYRGKRGEIGFDGLWVSPEGQQILVEVKTTDAYRITLDTLANYRKGLIKQGACDEERSSILVVVGR